MERFAVIGQPIEHSLSPRIHQFFAEQEGKVLQYEKIFGEEQQFSQQIIDFFAAGGRGLNVTLPFKERAYQMADKCTERCQEATAANTLWLSEGQLCADNTDGIGLLIDLKRYLNLENKTVLLLGAGGAARGIAGPLLAQNIKKLLIYNRSTARLNSFIKQFPQAVPVNSLVGDKIDLVINATSINHDSLNMHLDLPLWDNQTFAYDLSYQAKGTTQFVNQALRHGCQATDGLGMLVEQAAESFNIWHGLRPKTSTILAILRQEQGTSESLCQEH